MPDRDPAGTDQPVGTASGRTDGSHRPVAPDHPPEERRTDSPDGDRQRHAAAATDEAPGRADGATDPPDREVPDRQSTTQHSLSATRPDRETVEAYVPGHDTRELLEAIVADAFASLEYDVTPNARKATGNGNAVKEIDVWAEKPGVTFSAYASCKNHENEVGTPVIDREAGRVNALQQFPHLKVIVAPSFNDNARAALDNRGFVGIETGDRATMDNAGEVYDRVRTQLADLSLRLAPPRVQDLAERVDQVSAELSSLSGELRDLEEPTRRR
nr:restriction endonuclease [Halapricum sp. CBA1109]